MFRSNVTDVAATKYLRTPNDVPRRRRANTAKSENTASKYSYSYAYVPEQWRSHGGGGGGGRAAPPHFSQKNKDKKKLVKFLFIPKIIHIDDCLPY